MEPLSPSLRRNCDRTLAGAYILLAWLPLTYALWHLLADSSAELLTPTFFKLLWRSTVFAFIQASLSVFILALFALVLGYAESVAGFGAKAKKAFLVCGLFFFSLSPTFIALGLLNAFTQIRSQANGAANGEIPAGLHYIVLCHFLMNFGFIGTHFWGRISRSRAAAGDDLMLWLRSMGASPFTIMRHYVWPLFKNDFDSWGPQVFIWCFTSFAPVILLGVMPAQSTPEVMLYYSILNDSGGARILAIFAVTALLAFFLNRFCHSPLKLEESEGVAARAVKSSTLDVALYFFLALVCLPFLFNLLFGLTRATDFSGIYTHANTLLSPLAGSLATAVLSFLLVLGGGAICALSARKSRVILYSNFLSAPLILLGWIESGVGGSGSISRFALVALGNFVVSFPWVYRQIKGQLDRLPAEWPTLALSLGMDARSYYRRVLWPQMSPGLYRIAAIIGLWTFGDYAFAKALFNGEATLALFVDENLRRYNFPSASLGLFTALLVSIIVLTCLAYKGRKNA